MYDPITERCGECDGLHGGSCPFGSSYDDHSFDDLVAGLGQLPEPIAEAAVMLAGVVRK